MSNSDTYINAAAEGLVDEAVIERIVAIAGGHISVVYGGEGKHRLDKSLVGYNKAAQYSPWFVLRDLNSDAKCAPDLIKLLLPVLAPLICFRIAVRMIEAWLLADRAMMAEFLAVSTDRLPQDPESETNPKAVLVGIARHSKRRSIRGMVPPPGSGRTTGPAYSSLLIEFVREKWRPDVAAEASPSLRKALDCLGRLVAKYQSARR